MASAKMPPVGEEVSYTERTRQGTLKHTGRLTKCQDGYGFVRGARSGRWVSLDRLVKVAQ